jgi:hypothetical protein
MRDDTILIVFVQQRELRAVPQGDEAGAQDR